MIYFSPTGRVRYSGPPDNPYKHGTRRVSGLTPPERAAVRAGHILLIKSTGHAQATKYKRVILKNFGYNTEYRPVNYTGQVRLRTIPYTPITKPEKRIHKRRAYRLPGKGKPKQLSRYTACGQFRAQKAKDTRVSWDTVTCKLCLKARRTNYDKNDNYINKD